MTTAPITHWLRHAADGDRDALGAVFAALYPELRRVAHARLRAHPHGGELGTTTLVHESFLRLVDAAQLRLHDRKHFFTYAAKTMRHIVIDEARAARAERRGGDLLRVTFDGDEALAVPGAGPAHDEQLAVHQALGELEALDAGLAELVELRYFGGYTESEVAGLLGVNERTVRRRWDKARGFLLIALRGRAEAA